MFLRYSSSVVAPMTCSSPRASAGLSMLPASIAPSAAPAPTTRVQLVDEEDQISPSFAVISSITFFRRSSKSPRYWVPATMPARSSATTRLVRERLRHLVVDDPLGEALDDRGLADAGLTDQHRVVLRSPREDLDRLLDLVGAADHRVELPLAGHAAVRSRPYWSSVGVLRSLAWAPPASTPRMTAPRSLVCETPKRCMSWPAWLSSSRASASSTCSGPRTTIRARATRRTRRAVRPWHRVTRDGETSVRSLCSASSSICAAIAPDRRRSVQDVAYDVVLERGVEEVVAVEIEAAPFESRLRGALEQLAGGVAEELRDVDALNWRCGAPRRRVRPRPTIVAEEIGEEVVEEAAAAAETGSTSAPRRDRSRRGIRPLAVPSGDEGGREKRLPVVGDAGKRVGRRLPSRDPPLGTWKENVRRGRA